jgi:hypothetical protein
MYRLVREAEQNALEAYVAFVERVFPEAVTHGALEDGLSATAGPDPTAVDALRDLLVAAVKLACPHCDMHYAGHESCDVVNCQGCSKKYCASCFAPLCMDYETSHFHATMVGA